APRREAGARRGRGVWSAVGRSVRGPACAAAARPVVRRRGKGAGGRSCWARRGWEAVAHIWAAWGSLSPSGRVEGTRRPLLVTAGASLARFGAGRGCLSPISGQVPAAGRPPVGGGVVARTFTNPASEAKRF